VRKSVANGEYIRPAGQDVQRGDQILKIGRRLRPVDIGMLAALGVAAPLVFRIPRVAVFSTGDELVEVDQAFAPGQIRDSNSYALAAAVQIVEAHPLCLGIVPDQLEMVIEQFEYAVDEGADLILSSVGVSMGAHDYVRLALEKRGELHLWRVNIRPGKPLAIGRFQRVLFIGLPGNPVSALVTFDVFARAAIARIAGASEERPWIVTAILEEDIESDGRESYLRARVWFDGATHRARLTGSQDSGVLSSMVMANALLIVPAGTCRIEAASRVQIWLLSSSGWPVVRWDEGCI
jgi:molybdopterin molybdotransferase